MVHGSYKLKRNIVYTWASSIKTSAKSTRIISLKILACGRLQGPLPLRICTPSPVYRHPLWTNSLLSEQIFLLFFEENFIWGRKSSVKL